ncbi:MAG: hypothetical protein SOZ59_04285 [Candidatus Limivivens sp.]|nr:hypothetical protein [Candidatus Limivivens sp.]
MKLEFGYEMLKKLQEAALLLHEEPAVHLLKMDREYQKLSEYEKKCEHFYQQLQEILPKEDAASLAEILNVRDREAILYHFVSVQHLHRYDSQTHENRLRRWGLLTPESYSYGLISR